MSKSLARAARKFASWKYHPSRKVVHTGFTVKPVRSYCFAFRQADGELCSCAGAGEGADVAPIIRARSTLRKNAPLIYTGEVNDVIRGAEQAFRELVPPVVVAGMQKASSRCEGRWMLGREGKRSLFSTLGVNIQYAQHYHVDADDAVGSLSCVVYSVKEESALFGKGDDVGVGAGTGTAATAAATATAAAAAAAADTCNAASAAEASLLAAAVAKKGKRKRKRNGVGTNACAKEERGGQLILPHLGVFIDPSDGDFVAWRTNHVLHGVAPCGGVNPWRTAFVLFQTDALSRACLACSD